ncbi:MAG: chemotaxis protein CheD [Lachnospirales bacterium]
MLLKETALVVGLGDMKIAKFPQNITTMGLGSCVGITMYDPHTKLGGLLHAMMPYIDELNNKSNKYMFVDEGIKEMLKVMISQGAKKSVIEIKVVGGAEMFSFTKDAFERIGPRNQESAFKTIMELGYNVKAYDCGKNYGRTITLDTKNGDLIVKSVGKNNKLI